MHSFPHVHFHSTHKAVLAAAVMKIAFTFTLEQGVKRPEWGRSLAAAVVRSNTCNRTQNHLQSQMVKNPPR